MEKSPCCFIFVQFIELEYNFAPKEWLIFLFYAQTYMCIF